MFNLEAEMTKPVLHWMQSLDLLVKSEFVSPWGMCDLVGLSFNKRNVSKRLKLRQTKPVASMIQAALLLCIPDIETGKFITMRELIDHCAPSVTSDVVIAETKRLIGQRFICNSNDRLQKVNGWMPLQKRLVAVEIKLKRVEEVMLQAIKNLGFADESYVALPAELAARIMKSARKNDFHQYGIGLLAVTSKSCSVIMRSHRQLPDQRNLVAQFYCVEKFWRTSAKDN